MFEKLEYVDRKVNKKQTETDAKKNKNNKKYNKKDKKPI